MLKMPTYQGMLMGDIQHMGGGETGHQYKLTAISNVVRGSKKDWRSYF